MRPAVTCWFLFRPELLLAFDRAFVALTVEGALGAVELGRTGAVVAVAVRGHSAIASVETRVRVTGFWTIKITQICNTG